MTQQSNWSCGGALFAAFFVFLLLTAELAAFSALLLYFIEPVWLEQAWDYLLSLNTLWPYASLVLLLVVGWFAFRILSSTFNCFASLAEPEGGGPGVLGTLAVLVGLTFVATVAVGYFLPELWKPSVEQWAASIGPDDEPIWRYLKAGAPYVQVYALLVAAASLHCFRLMGDDRQRMKNNDTRISLSGLHWWEWLGGWPGSLAGLMVFQHRAGSLVYLLGLTFAIAAHLATLAGVLWLLQQPVAVPPA